MLDDYYRAFSTLDVQAILPYFHEPSTLISSRGVIAAPTFAAVAAALKPTLEGLRAREFGRSELSVGSAKHLSARRRDAVDFTGDAVRYKRDGQELERVGITYVLHKAETGWKIAVIVLHDTQLGPPQSNS